MARSMFPFDDCFRVAFNGTLLPSQNKNGEIMPVEFPITDAEKFDLLDAPKIPSWRKKDMQESTTSTSSSNISHSSPETVMTDIETSLESLDLKVEEVDNLTASQLENINISTIHNNNNTDDKTSSELDKNVRDDIIRTRSNSA